MKLISLLVTLTSLVSFAFPTTEQPVYSEGDMLIVAATSGLRLRMHPNMKAPTIRIIPPSDSVRVENVYEFDKGHSDRINWIEGHWIKVRYRGSAGYVFDGFLTSLPLPDHEMQLCFEVDELIPTLDRYVNAQFEMLCIEEGPTHSEEMSNILTFYDGEIESVLTAGDGWYQMEYVFSGYRYSEIINLMRQMMVGDSLKGMFENSLVFHTDHTGRVDTINILLGESPIDMQVSPEGIITIKATILRDPECC